jgi:hypothetical protein
MDTKAGPGRNSEPLAQRQGGIRGSELPAHGTEQ